jgi:signal transduction histidine kinase
LWFVHASGSRLLAQLRRIADPLCAGAFAAIWLIGAAVTGGNSTRPHLATLEVLALAMSVPFAWRRRYPATVTVVVFSAGLLQALLFRDELPIGFVLTALVGSYSVGAHAPRRTAWLAGGYALVAAYIASFITSTEGLPSKLFTSPLFIGLPWAAGRLVARMAAQRSTLAKLNIQLEQERDAAARNSVLEERARIARELHDIVAHSISVMVVQAGAAEQFVDADSRAVEPLNAIRTTGQQALIEMRRLLGVLRTDDVSVLAPQPGLANLDALVDTARRDGLAVNYAVHGNPVAMPTGVDIATYRLVQEALSNVRKHAHATSVDVTLRFERDCLRVDIADDGVGSQPNSPAGHGLIGMRERVLLYGGTLDTGAREGRGWHVSAQLPLAG